MTEEKKMAEIEPKTENEEIEVNDLKEELTEDQMEEIQGGRGRLRARGN